MSGVGGDCVFVQLVFGVSDVEDQGLVFGLWSVGVEEFDRGIIMVGMGFSYDNVVDGFMNGVDV